MHVVIAVITAIAGLIWALNSLQRSGVDLNSFNPVFWMRRRQWAQQTQNPLYAITSPRELAALLSFAVLRQAGDPTAEQKSCLLRLYADKLQYGEEEAPEIYAVASHLLGTDPNYSDRIQDIINPAMSQMTAEQRSSIVEMANEIASTEGPPNDRQVDLIDRIRRSLSI